MQVLPPIYSCSSWYLKRSEVAQSCPTLCDPMDYSLPGSSIHGIFQARVLEESPAFGFPLILTQVGQRGIIIRDLGRQQWLATGTQVARTWPRVCCQHKTSGHCSHGGSRNTNWGCCGYLKSPTKTPKTLETGAQLSNINSHPMFSDLKKYW